MQSGSWWIWSQIQQHWAQGGKIHPGCDTSPSQSVTHTHIHTVIHTMQQSSIANPPNCMFLNSEWKPENLEQPPKIQGEHAKVLTGSNVSSGSNPEVWSCEVVMLPGVTLFHTRKSTCLNIHLNPHPVPECRRTDLTWFRTQYRESSHNCNIPQINSGYFTLSLKHKGVLFYSFTIKLYPSVIKKILLKPL